MVAETRTAVKSDLRKDGTVKPSFVFHGNRAAPASLIDQPAPRVRCSLLLTPKCPQFGISSDRSNASDHDKASAA
ncbi:hypothetical protein, partial [Mesorhizobium sp. M7A.T.Ca.US.000.02.1.1]|uniref:hypothetical protein n=1 Tax=Mesorhizobium sp. M7A.T.Ca.US.000.02.1.1 TaxID=2496792 RepID=UPI0019D470C6